MSKTEIIKTQGNCTGSFTDMTLSSLCVVTAKTILTAEFSLLGARETPPHRSSQHVQQFFLGVAGAGLATAGGWGLCPVNFGPPDLVVAIRTDQAPIKASIGICVSVLIQKEGPHRLLVVASAWMAVVSAAQLVVVRIDVVIAVRVVIVGAVLIAGRSGEQGRGYTCGHSRGGKGVRVAKVARVERGMWNGEGFMRGFIDRMGVWCLVFSVLQRQDLQSFGEYDGDHSLHSCKIELLLPALTSYVQMATLKCHEPIYVVWWSREPRAEWTADSVSCRERKRAGKEEEGENVRGFRERRGEMATETSLRRWRSALRNMLETGTAALIRKFFPLGQLGRACRQ
ncbi:hypothetical protein BDK51DRAFT_31319 [Blyttiomyces helicus]|uniref:Uncharacterized protein n=1 Tax=Blyttiomyces helicus TaxID=388810 RepID=A0A4P9WQC8_9FUNG|nr:hypothetical protein BDK51DRAFT_31319 [Blyttiomyces helicus]|eukprot:RKO93420.1 hypothetical protein BDK51DRAFT_31319 [Blyttiomyces helicus]